GPRGGSRPAGRGTSGDQSRDGSVQGRAAGVVAGAAACTGAAPGKNPLTARPRAASSGSHQKIPSPTLTAARTGACPPHGPGTVAASTGRPAASSTRRSTIITLKTLM